jgi:very-short-patch-repair endonuclease
MPKPTTAVTAFGLLELSDLTEAAHRPLATWLDAGTLARAEAAASELVDATVAEQAARDLAADVFSNEVLKAPNLLALAQRFVEQHHGPLARFSGQYKADRAAVTALTRAGTWHKELPRRLGDALAWQQAAARVAALVSDHAYLLGHYTPQDGDGFDRLQQALVTARRVVALSAQAEQPDRVVARLADSPVADPLIPLLARAVRGALTGWCEAADRRIARWTEQVSALLGLFTEARTIQLSPQLSGGLGQARSLIDRLHQDRQGTEEWRAYSAGLEQLRLLSVDELVARSVERGFEAADFPAIVEGALLRAWANAVLDSDPRLLVSRSTDLDARVEGFRTADRRLVAAARGAVVETVNSRRPRSFAGGSAAVIAREAEKKTRHMPVRDLLSRTGEVVRLVKPCFMMSPLTVSQFVPSDYHFDVVIFDEASQVRPSDAANCIYRGRALIVAGDEKQLPPTSFFDAAVGDDSDEWDEDLPDSFESLLHACRAGAMRTLDLHWHYRSRHEDLITFSNRSFYGNSMVTFPGAQESGNHVGVEFFRTNGVYDRGGRADNTIEAELVARRVLHHFDTRPGQSLGVVALSQAQASAIELAVEQARHARPDLDRFFTEDRLGGFFVKNLESVQGDERDVMIMSVGYGPDQHGRLSLNFGPINRPGGWRRLNVAVTRARYRMELVASFAGDELGDSDNESVQHLKRYLQYAEHGPAVLAQQIVQEQAAPESPFEESVLDVLRAWGYQVQPQVGVAGYRIDLGLRHPDALGSYALGIECDGAMYHSSKVARDRDRLREEVLSGLGWKLYRIWGTDWYRDRIGAQNRLRTAVEAAVANAPGAMPNTALSGAATAPLQRPDTDTLAAAAHAEPERVPVAANHARTWAVPYRSPQIQVFSGSELHTVEARPELCRLLSGILEAEGPIHEDLLILRAREAWGLARSGSRIRDNIRAVLGGLMRAGIAKETETGVFSLAGNVPLQARTPDPRWARKVMHVPSAERRLALYELASECPGMSREELLRAACDFFGWGRMGADIRSALEADMAQMFRDSRLAGTNDRITAVAIGDDECRGGTQVEG